MGFFASYRVRLPTKINASLQLNVGHIQENARCQPISAFPDGTPNAFRIVVPRQFILSMNFDL